jgi:FkbM family methyltransferase
MLRKLVRTLGYAALKSGWRVPGPDAAIDYLHQGQLLDLIRKLRINCVLDVGAHHGWFSQRLRWAGFEGHIVTFEPIKANHAHIAEKAAGDRRWQQAGYALGETKETRQFNLLIDGGGGNTMSSFLTPTIGGAVSVQEVEVNRLEDVLPALLREVSDPRIFLKIDTQGFDLPVLRGAGSWLPRILGLQSEVSVVPIYENMMPYTDALAAYHGMGFELMHLQVVNRTGSGGVLEYDCLMARR